MKALDRIRESQAARPSEYLFPRVQSGWLHGEAEQGDQANAAVFAIRGILD